MPCVGTGLVIGFCGGTSWWWVPVPFVGVGFSWYLVYQSFQVLRWSCAPWGSCAPPPSPSTFSANLVRESCSGGLGAFAAPPLAVLLSGGWQGRLEDMDCIPGIFTFKNDAYDAKCDFFMWCDEVQNFVDSQITCGKDENVLSLENRVARLEDERRDLNCIVLPNALKE
ncbi:hypothetical protein Taro_054828 [Colocasia esculenta]|uniref:Uncharacterized protein n=1 Tax=Colocasia esculenta TaxID=4460 RepID=A0A843XRJ4_COLES|nr:hypothetical protein [Colocasia esculenta]